MSEQTFRALLVREVANGQFDRAIVTRSVDDLPPGDVLIRVRYSSLNYKDALSATGNKGVTRKYPHTPGIDAAGVVEACASDAFHPGDEVLACNYDIGSNTPGGHGQYVRVPAAWVMARPAGLSLCECMIYGTAGFTAALCVERLQAQGAAPARGPVLVTGATGGVGSLAVALLARLGYEVVAATGKLSEREYLLGLGAREVVQRDEVNDTSGRALLKGRWAGAVDTVGGNYLATAIRSTQPGGTVTCCGNAASPDLALTVYPFILRGVSLIGVDASACPMDLRQRVWDKLAGEWKLDSLDRMATEVTLDQLDPRIERMLQGQLRGRTIVNLAA
jgi:acrylyl-CoA reductase (NADPH)